MSRGQTKDAQLSLDDDGIYDFTLDSEGDISTKDFLDTSILMSLFAERRATASEVPASHRRRGWIGNELSNFEIGSKTWMFEQARLSRDTLSGILSAAREAFKWIVDDKIALSVEVSSEFTLNSAIAITIILTRPNSKVEKRFFELWENTGNVN